MVITCGVCTTVNSKDVDFCEGCGAELIQPRSVPPVTIEIVPLPALAPNTLRLAVKRQGSLTGTKFLLGGERLILGRFDTITGPVDIDLTGLPGCETVSRLHAELFCDQGHWFVKDLGSTNGVFVKLRTGTSFGSRLSAPYRLELGDELALGNARLVLIEEGPRAD
ncbi:FHA domain-containing protein [Candidatus Cyanaurora vandensis]|uniref:FHA domain-containing protein n=1 Tax=Candidatus Cyanaurora vandensis TaxID=2714958 RepID=UPI002579F823|nr:FHA domain-containing protein [Candidatus Cyanaurora vandensis]